MLVYLDTSALAKWYLDEPGSDAFAGWIQSKDDVHISTLTALELRSLLSRRRRMQQLSAQQEQEVFATFLDDVGQGHLIQHTMQDRHVTTATALLEQLVSIPLRTLDALQLSIARAIGAECLATADRVMAQACTSLGLETFNPV